MLAGLDQPTAALEQRPELLLLATAGLVAAQLIRLTGQIARQQVGIIRIGLVAHADRFAVMHQLARADQIDLDAELERFVDTDQMVGRGRLEGDAHRPVEPAQPGADRSGVVVQRDQRLGGSPVTGDQMVLGDIDSERDLSDGLCHNDLRGCMTVKPGTHRTRACMNRLLAQLDS